MNAREEAMGSDPGLSLDEAEAEQERLWERIESKRHILTKSINPSKLTTYLRQCKVIDEEDEDEILHSHLLTSRRTRAGRLLDILRSRGNRGYEAFLDSLELYYAELYKLITGKEPTRCCSVLVVEEGYEGLTHFLMNEAVKVQKQLKDRDVEIQKLQGKCQELQEANKQLSHQNQGLRGFEERYNKLKEEFKVFNNQFNKVREDSYLLAMKHTQLHEEKNMVVMRNRDLQLENDQMRCKLAGMEKECLLARRVSSKLREDMESMPSKESISKLQLDNQQLRSTIQELQHFLQSKNNLPSMDKAFLDIMDHDRREALEERQALVEKFHNISLELQQAEELRDKFQREKEDLGLQITLLTKECQMQKRRVETILLQIEEVEKERDQALKARDEVQSVNAQLLLDNSRYRRQVWGMEEKSDRLQMELTRKEGELSVLQHQLMEQRSTSISLDLPDFCSSVSSSPNSLGCPEDWSSEDQKRGRNFPTSALSRRNGIKRLELSSAQSSEFPESGYGEETSTMEVLWPDIENDRYINRFSMIPFPPCKASLMRRIKDEEAVGRFEFRPLSSSMDFGNSCPDKIQNLSLSFTAGSERDFSFPDSEDLGEASTNVKAGSNRSSISIDVKHDHEHILSDLTIVGGNTASILANPEHQGSEPQQGYQLLGLEGRSGQRTTLQNCTGKDTFWTLRHCVLPDPLQLQPSKAYRTLQRALQVKEPLGGDSFYIRVNLNILGQVDSCSLQVKCDEILHVLDTNYHSGSEWLCARVDPVTMQDLEQGTIPSCNRAHQLLMVKIHALIGNFQKNERTRKFMKNYNKLKALGRDQVRIVAARLSRNPSSTSSPSFSFCREDTNEKVIPYSLVQPITVHQKRPVLIMPTVLAKPLIQRILQSPATSEFDVVRPEVLTKEELKTKTWFSFQRIPNQDKYESITLEAIRDVIAKNKHGLLPLGVHTVKDLISKDIYTIIIHIKVTSKNIKKLRKLVPKSCGSDDEFLRLHRIEQKHLESVPCLSATVEPNTWGNVDELAKAVKESIFQEQTKLVWIEQD
ncbi:caspase recruitment domain-containing protein 11-like isoform X2 [Pristis pectinata]|uniref:caspase recruitment domain-containing protein 11-like isoform X2 n=1 Tax=Pristis pectinata TaxID=685728 RepID=UPI00223E358A|nr:caspase recruitment domain-containing protein 11-like isoform X2 [Pristis pectinata]